MLYYGCWKHKKFRFRIKTFSFRDIWQHLYHDKCKCLTLPSAVFRWVGESALGHTLLRSRYPRVSVIMTYLFSLSIPCKNLNRSAWLLVVSARQWASVMMYGLMSSNSSINTWWDPAQSMEMGRYHLIAHNALCQNHRRVSRAVLNENNA